MLEIVLVLVLLAITGALAMRIAGLQRAAAAAGKTLFLARTIHADAQRLLHAESQAQETHRPAESVPSPGTSLLRKVRSDAATAPLGWLDGDAAANLVARAAGTRASAATSDSKKSAPPPESASPSRNKSK